jgi:2-polyprenyl-6-methoxyphenol hydroxylase-like FAD-dependent oxidoreductase
MTTQPRFQHAIVIGGSIGGMLAARVLSDHFARVTIVERDALPNDPTSRRGAPQARHLHVLLARGQRILNQLFSGIEDDLHRVGALQVDWLRRARACTPDGWTQNQPSDLISFACSRDLLEWVIRQRMRQIANISFVQGRIDGLIASEDRRRVLGVHLAEAGDQSDNASLHADLVVDASGRTSRLPEWFEEMGYTRPAETVIDSKLGYASRMYAAPAGFTSDWQVLLITANAPTETRGGVIMYIEQNRLIVTLSGYASDYPPTDEEGFLAFARTLRTPILHDLLSQSKPLTPISGYQRTENRWRRYDQLSRQPEGLIAIGDAVCAFNPVYGQGMTMSALGAMELDRALRQVQGDQLADGFAHSFQRRLPEPANWPGPSRLAKIVVGRRPKEQNRLLCNGYSIATWGCYKKYRPTRSK